jgi:hypothetical protein
MNTKDESEKLSLEKFAVGRESVPLDKVHSIRWQWSFKLIIATYII